MVLSFLGIGAFLLLKQIASDQRGNFWTILSFLKKILTFVCFMFVAAGFFVFDGIASD